MPKKPTRTQANRAARPSPARKPGVLPAAAAIPAVPEREKPLEGPVKQALLKVPTEQRAEVDQALEQLWKKRAQLVADLGTLAPDAERGKALHARMAEAREVNRRAQALAVYSDDQEALANHEVMAYLNEVAGDIEHMAQKNPQIASRYDRVVAVVAQRREAIAAGMARARAAKAGEPR